MAKNTNGRKHRVLAQDANTSAPNTEVVTETLYDAGTMTPAAQARAAFLMDVSDSGHAEILDELTDLSANKGAYAIREAYSNAHDATMRAGDMTRPIEITVPSIEMRGDTLADKLSIASADAVATEFAYVTDHGIGMTEYDLRTYFTQYGGSNKRGAASEIGSKGLGSKAPLACADYFDVITMKDGVRTTMHLWRGEGGNYAEITGSEPCPADQTGTSIRIPVTDPVIAQQMRACALDIADRNTDAVVVVNGFRRDGNFGYEVGSSYWHGSEAYIYVGKLHLADSPDGSPVTAPAWVRRNALMRSLCQLSAGHGIEQMNWAVDANLCGVGYMLHHGNRYNASDPADLIVELQPGYLNFTVSRDEIKDDRKLRAVMSCIRAAVGETDFWGPVLRNARGDLDVLDDIINEREIAFRRRSDGRWQIESAPSESQSGARVLSDEEEGYFRDDDGNDFAPLLSTVCGADPDGHEAVAIGWWSSADNGKSPRFHASVACQGWPCDQHDWHWGTSRRCGTHGENSFGSSKDGIKEAYEKAALQEMVAIHKFGIDLGWDVAVLGSVADADRFAQVEHSIRRHFARLGSQTVNEVRLLYLLCPDPITGIDDLSDAERFLLDGFNGHVEVADLEAMAATCRAEDRAHRGKARRKGPKPIGTRQAMAMPIDAGEFSDACDLIAVTAEDDRLPDWESRDIDVDALDEGSLVVLGIPSPYQAHIVAAHAMLLQKVGRLDASFSEIVFLPCLHAGRRRGGELYAHEAKRVARAVTLLADLREGWAVETLPAAIAGDKTDVPDLDAIGVSPDRAALAAMSGISSGMRDQMKVLHDLVGYGHPLVEDVAAERERKDYGNYLLAPKTSDPKVGAIRKWAQGAQSVLMGWQVRDSLDMVSSSGNADCKAFMTAVLGGMVRRLADELEAGLRAA